MHSTLDSIYDVIVVGGGASGMMAAGHAAENGAKALLLEKNNKLGSKLLITGKGRCNITNIGEINDFIESYGKNGRFLYRAFQTYFNYDLMGFFEKYGIKTKTERGGRVFPVSDESGSIVYALKQYLNKNNVNVKLNLGVKKINTEKNSVASVVLHNNQVIKTKNAILATGGLSYPKTGSTGDGYRFAKELGHTIEPLRPALVPLETKENFVKKLQGLSLRNVLITVFADDKEIASEFGEMLFTHFGVSGPIILKISGDVVDRLRKNENVSISINLKPALDSQMLDNRISREIRNNNRKSIKNMLKNMLPSSLIPVFLNLAGIPEHKKCNQINQKELKKIRNLIFSFKITIIKSRSIDEAIITRGGISLDQINPYTMESKIVKGLYFCGELIDIDGITGGFNLQAAFSTGYLAGNNKFR
ncbi:MAG: NAD(P)/FAD-dependent oxidoreductase [Endomicrobiales bacterium]|nr:NAD(P)/FAD-dependent oxidoreductase [Endomicrobiales bacterium]